MSAMFPASYSTLSPDALAHYIAEHYGYSDVQCSLILRGVGDTYTVATKDDKFILRVYRALHRNELQVREETDLLLKLKDEGVPVSYPVEDMTGNVIHSLPAAEGMRQAVLFSYAPGEVVNVLNEAQLHNLGKELARVHNIAAQVQIGGSRWNYDLETTLFKPLAMLEDAFVDDRDNYNWLQQAANMVAAKLATMDTTKVSYGICHFDIMNKNFHVHQNSITFFDFDFMGYGWLVNDIMTFWQQLCLDVQFGRMKQEQADTSYAIFLEGYKSQRVISDEELAAVPYLNLGFWLFYSGFHTTHDQFFTFIQPSHIKQRFRMVRAMLEKHWQG